MIHPENHIKHLANAKLAVQAQAFSLHMALP